MISGLAHIVGGSLGGLFAANALHRAGWRVRIHERVADALAGRGAGIVTHPELFEALAFCGCVLDERLGVQVQTRVTLARDGRELARLESPQVLTAWSRLYQLLRESLPGGVYAHGRHVTAVADGPEGARLHFADGTHEDGDLVLAADGIRSTVRQQLLPEVQPAYAGYVAWRGLVEERQLGAAAHAALFPHFGFCLPENEQMLGYPVAGPGHSVLPGERRYNFVWYRPADDASLDALLTDAAGRRHEGGIPPPAIRPEVVAAMRQDAERLLAPAFAEVVRATEQPFFQPIFDLVCPRMAFGHVALMGDAAFVARPHCGMGVTKAAGDALALVRALQAHAGVPAALQAYETERLRYGREVVEHARDLGAHLQMKPRTPAEQRMAERFSSAEAVMRNAGSSGAFEARRPLLRT